MNKASIFMGASWAGLAGLALVLVAAFQFDGSLTAIVGATIAVACCWAMLFTRNADEYTRGLWVSGSSLAFATLLVLFFAIPAGEGFYDGFRSVIEDRDADDYQQDIPTVASIAAAIGAFYIGLFWKRMRGGV